MFDSPFITAHIKMKNTFLIFDLKKNKILDRK